jgi:hypothetical protein
MFMVLTVDLLIVPNSHVFSLQYDHVFTLHLPILSSLFEGLHEPVISIGKSVNDFPLVC